MFRLAFWKKISREEFASQAIAYAGGLVSKPTPLTANIRETTRKIRLLPKEFPDTECARIYQELERYITQEELEHRTSKEALRGEIGKRFGAEEAEGDFALLFLPTHLKNLRLFERLTDRLLETALPMLDKDSAQKLHETLRTLHPIGEALDHVRFYWDQYEKHTATLSPREIEEKAINDFRGVSTKITEVLTEYASPVRAGLALQKAYQALKTSFPFIEDLAFVLKIFPDNTLSEERISALPAEELKQSLKINSAQLEATLHELQAQKQKLAQTLEQLKSADAVKTDFITVVSHHFRTPLSVIRWNSEIMMENAGSKKTATKETKEALQAIQGKAMFLINTLDDVFDVLAIEGGDFSVQKKPGQLWEVVAEILEEAKKDFGNPERKVVFDKAKAPVKELLFDKAKIMRILKILVRNADQLSPVETPIEISIKEDDWNGKPAIYCAVKDGGIGVAKGDRAKLFQKFFRADDAMRIAPDGVGLGLYIARRFAEAHGGTLEADATQKKGATFTLILPE